MKYLLIAVIVLMAPIMATAATVYVSDPAKCVVPFNCGEADCRTPFRCTCDDYRTCGGGADPIFGENLNWKGAPVVHRSYCKCEMQYIGGTPWWKQQMAELERKLTADGWRNVSEVIARLSTPGK